MAEEASGLNIWSDRDLGVDSSPVKFIESISDADIEYICNCKYPFLQLINANAVFEEDLPLNFITASTGWVIHDYGEAISVAAPHYSVESKEVQGNNSNIINQATTVEEIANIISNKGWAEVELISGTSMMKRCVWMEAKKFKFTLIGYTPSTSDQKCFDRLAKRAKDMGLVWERAISAKAQQTGATTAE